jgi:hypothetical protein
MNPSEIKAKRIDTDANSVRIVVAGRASYCYVLEPTPDDKDKPDGTKSYKTAVLIPKNAPTEVTMVLTQGIKDAIEIGIRKKWGGKRPAELDLPIKDGDKKAREDAEKYGAYAGNRHFTSKRAERQGRPRLKAHGKDVDVAGVIESGDWCVFDINFYPFNNKNKGVACALNGVTLIKEGERFGGGPSKDAIDAAANDLYGSMLSEGVSSSDADDLFNSLSGGAKGNDDLMSLLG